MMPEERNIHGETPKDIQGNDTDKNVHGNRPKDAQGNPPKDIHGNATSE